MSSSTTTNSDLFNLVTTHTLKRKNSLSVSVCPSSSSRTTDLQAGDGELGHQLQELCVIVKLHQLPQLVVGLETHKQATELMVTVRISQRLCVAEKPQLSKANV